MTQAPPTKRPYRQVARAAATEATAERIVDAVVALFWEGPGATISLDAVAVRAGVSVQTVIRRFGGRDGLMEAAVTREIASVERERDPAEVTTPKAAIHQLVDHYERRGDAVIRLLAEEVRQPSLRAYADPGRRAHREWCAAVFPRALAGLDPDDRRRRLAELVAICDVYTWKLLRRDAGLDRAATERALLEMLEPLIGGS